MEIDHLNIAFLLRGKVRNWGWIGGDECESERRIEDWLDFCGGVYLHKKRGAILQ